MKKTKTLKLVSAFLILILVGLTIACAKPAPAPAPATTPAAAPKPATTPAAAAKPIVLRSSTYSPTSAAYQKDLAIPVLKRIEERSGGRVKFESYYGGELLPYKEEIEGLRKGVADFIVPSIATVYDEANFPVFPVMYLPAKYSDAKVGTYIALQRDSKDPYFKQVEPGRKGLKSFGWTGAVAYGIATTGKEINKPEDFKGLVLRVANLMGELTASGLGATPNRMPPNDVYEALSRRVVDGVILSLIDIEGYKQNEFLKYYITGICLGQSTAPSFMLQEKWDSLPPDIQKIFETTFEETAWEVAEKWEKKQQDLMKDWAAKGSKFVSFDKLSPDVQKLIGKAAVSSTLGWIEATEKKGAPGREAAKRWAQWLKAGGGQLFPEVEAELFK
ncbi:MAG: TRAP transporter substrate-binding protein DctP [Chloroflexi bacterium]|nr:TRAP transporter substrate-binding protein DctP [Chloroflexota bacterium]